jgi:cytochrome c peroxidase
MFKNNFLASISLFVGSILLIAIGPAQSSSVQSKLNLTKIRLGQFICHDPRIIKGDANPCVLPSNLRKGPLLTKMIKMMETNPHYLKMFQEEYEGKITLNNIDNAIAEYNHSLSLPSRFDDYRKGDKQALTPEEIKGYKLFNSYGCAACHEGPNFGGKKFKKMGAAKNYMIGHYTLITPADLGLYEVTKNVNDQFVFKVPTLRNVSITYPYYHDGSVETLQQAVYLMGKYQLDVEIPDNDIAAIVAFLNSLTGKGLN